MEFNAEQIKRVLEHCTNWAVETGCKGCPYDGDCIEMDVMNDALSLIKELTEENERLRAEKVESLIQEGKKRNEIKPAKDITKITRYIDLVEFEQRIKKYVKAETPEQKELVEWCKDECIRQAYCMPFTNDAMIADTVRKMQERFKQAICDNTYPDFNKDGKPINVWKATTGYDLIDQIAKEMLEG